MSPFSLYDGLPPPSSAANAPTISAIDPDQPAGSALKNNAKLAGTTLTLDLSDKHTLKVPVGWSLSPTAVKQTSKPPESVPVHEKQASESMAPEQTAVLASAKKQISPSTLAFQPTRLLVGHGSNSSQSLNSNQRLRKVHAMTSKIVSLFDEYDPTNPNDYIQFKQRLSERRQRQSSETGATTENSTKFSLTEYDQEVEDRPRGFSSVQSKKQYRQAPPPPSLVTAPSSRNNEQSRPPSFTVSSSKSRPPLSRPSNDIDINLINPDIDGLPLTTAVPRGDGPQSGEDAYLRRLQMSGTR